MKYDQLKVLSISRDMNCADLCVVTPQGRISLCILKFFRKGSKGAVFSVDIFDESAGTQDRDVDQTFLLHFFEFIEGSIFKEFHDAGPACIHSMEISWGSRGLNLIKYYGERVGCSPWGDSGMPSSFRTN